MNTRLSFLSVVLVAAGAALLFASATGGVQAGPLAGQSIERPSDGFTLHVDAIGHFPGNPNMVAHHWCKPVAGGLIECQLYDSDAADARLVGTEMIVDTAAYGSFDEAEQALWHYHREEIPAVKAALPDLSAEEAAKVVESLQETYGKLYLFWDPGLGDQPVGNPSVVVVQDGVPSFAALP